MEWLKGNASFIALVAAGAVGAFVLYRQGAGAAEAPSGGVNDLGSWAIYSGGGSGGDYGIRADPVLTDTSAPSAAVSEALSRYTIDAQLEVARLAYNTAAIQSQATLASAFLQSGSRISEVGFEGGLQFSGYNYTRELSNYGAEQLIANDPFVGNWQQRSGQTNVSTLITSSYLDRAPPVYFNPAPPQMIPTPANQVFNQAYPEFGPIPYYPPTSQPSVPSTVELIVTGGGGGGGSGGRDNGLTNFFSEFVIPTPDLPAPYNPSPDQLYVPGLDAQAQIYSAPIAIAPAYVSGFDPGSEYLGQTLFAVEQVPAYVSPPSNPAPDQLYVPGMDAQAQSSINVYAPAYLSPAPIIGGTYNAPLSPQIVGSAPNVPEAGFSGFEEYGTFPAHYAMGSSYLSDFQQIA